MLALRHRHLFTPGAAVASSRLLNRALFLCASRAHTASLVSLRHRSLTLLTHIAIQVPLSLSHVPPDLIQSGQWASYRTSSSRRRPPVTYFYRLPGPSLSIVDPPLDLSLSLCRCHQYVCRGTSNERRVLRTELSSFRRVVGISEP